jgi:hypothetical protein
MNLKEMIIDIFTKADQYEFTKNYFRAIDFLILSGIDKASIPPQNDKFITFLYSLKESNEKLFIALDLRLQEYLSY